jgi:hypothetical protein
MGLKASILAVPAALALALGACGEDPTLDAALTTGLPSTPSVRWCPADEGDKGFDTKRIIGLSEAEAESLAGAEGDCVVRVIVRDGESLPATMDFNPSRINVEVEDGKVTEVVSLG